MKEEKFVLMSLKEAEAKRIGQVIGNETARKILDFLANVDSATETEIKEKLQMPISTVHYNLSALKDAGLILAKEYHYSSKGKEVNHYSLARKYVIIAPEEAPEGLKEKLKSILPAALVSVSGALMLYLYRYLSLGQEKVMGEEPMLMMQESDTARAVLQDSAPGFFQELFSRYAFSLWFLGGALFALLCYLLISWLRNRKHVTSTEQ